MPQLESTLDQRPSAIEDVPEIDDVSNTSMWHQFSSYLPETEVIFDSSAEYAKTLVREMFTL